MSWTPTEEWPSAAEAGFRSQSEVVECEFECRQPDPKERRFTKRLFRGGAPRLSQTVVKFALTAASLYAELRNGTRWCVPRSSIIGMEVHGPTVGLRATPTPGSHTTKQILHFFADFADPDQLKVLDLAGFRPIIITRSAGYFRILRLPLLILTLWPLAYCAQYVPQFYRRWRDAPSLSELSFTSEVALGAWGFSGLALLLILLPMLWSRQTAAIDTRGYVSSGGLFLRWTRLRCWSDFRAMEYHKVTVPRRTNHGKPVYGGHVHRYRLRFRGTFEPIRNCCDTRHPAKLAADIKAWVEVYKAREEESVTT